MSAPPGPAGNNPPADNALVRAPRQAIVNNAVLSLGGPDPSVNNLELFFAALTAKNDPIYTKEAIVHVYEQLTRVQETTDIIRVRLFDHFVKLFKANPTAFDIENFGKFKDDSFPHVETVRRRSNMIVNRNNANYASLARTFGEDVLNHYVIRVMTANKPLSAIARLGRDHSFDNFDQLLVAVNRATLDRLTVRAWDTTRFMSTSDIEKVIREETPVTTYTQADYDTMQRLHMCLLRDGTMVPHADAVNYGLDPVDGYGAALEDRPATPPTAGNPGISVGVTPQAERFADFDIDSDNDDSSIASNPPADQDPLAGTEAGARRDAKRAQRRANRCACPKTRRRYIKQAFRKLDREVELGPDWIRTAGKITKYVARPGSKLCNNHQKQYAVVAHTLAMSMVEEEFSDLEEDVADAPAAA